jgi:hypothetical protein
MALFPLAAIESADSCITTSSRSSLPQVSKVRKHQATSHSMYVTTDYLQHYPLISSPSNHNSTTSFATEKTRLFEPHNILFRLKQTIFEATIDHHSTTTRVAESYTEKDHQDGEDSLKLQVIGGHGHEDERSPGMGPPAAEMSSGKLSLASSVKRHLNVCLRDPGRRHVHMRHELSLEGIENDASLLALLRKHYDDQRGWRKVFRKIDGIRFVQVCRNIASIAEFVAY